jgi:hypothetical protein
VTELNIFGYSSTQSWQGYFGNVTGVIQLANGADKVMYNWSAASPRGEIYASTNGSGIIWQNIQCLNFTAKGSYAGDTAGGGTSQNGTNLTQLETMFGITSDAVDGVDETFNLLGTGHREFYASNINFSEGKCQSTRIFADNGAGADNEFEEVLLYEPASKSVIFTTLLNENILGFDQRYHDFEMLVLENGHGSDTSTTTYYFYVELE